MPKCKDVMTPDPVCCEPSDSIIRAAEIMKQEDVGSVPVVESQSSRRLIGIVTDRDLVVQVLAGGRDVDQATVRDAMTSNPATCQEDDDVEEAMELMAERQVRRVPIVDATGRLSGIIAQADVATRVGKDRKTAEVVESISDTGMNRR